MSGRVSTPRLALLSALGLVYSLCYVAIKAGLEYAPPFAFAGLRAGIAGAVLVVAVSVRSRALLPPRRLWTGVVALGLLGTTMGYGAMFMAPGRSGAGISSVLGNTGSLFLVVLGWLFLGERLTRRKLEALGAGAVGVTLISYPAVTDPTLAGPTAALFPLAAALALAGSAVILKRIDARDTLGHVVAWQLLVGAVPLLVLSSRLEVGSEIQWTPEFGGLLAFLAIVGTAVATWVWYWLVQREDVGRLGVFMFAVPLGGLILAWALFGEPISARTVLGALLTIVAVGRVAAPGGRVAAVGP